MQEFFQTEQFLQLYQNFMTFNIFALHTTVVHSAILLTSFAINAFSFTSLVVMDMDVDTVELDDNVDVISN